MEGKKVNSDTIKSYLRLKQEKFSALLEFLNLEEIKKLIHAKKFDIDNLDELVLLDTMNTSNIRNIFQRSNILRLLDENKLSGIFLVNISCFNDKTLDNLNNLLNNPIIYEIIGDKGISDFYLSSLANSTEEEFKILEEILKRDYIQQLLQNNEINGYTLHLAKSIDEKQLKQIDRLAQSPFIKSLIETNKFEGASIITLGELTKENEEHLGILSEDRNIKQMLQNGTITSASILNFASYPKFEFMQLMLLLKNNEIAKLIQDKKITPQDLNVLANSNISEFKQLIFLLKNKEIATLIHNGELSAESLKRFTKFDEDKFERLTTILNNENIKNLIKENKLSDENLNNLYSYKYDKGTFAKIIYILGNGFEKIDIYELYKFLQDNPNLNIEDFCSYRSEINFKELEHIAPEIKSFTQTNKLYFTLEHYKNKKTSFNKDDLIYKKDFEEYLKNHFIDAKNMQRIYSAYPNTERIIGNLPQDWQNIIKDKKGKKEIINAIDDFIKTRDIDKFKTELSKIFNQEVKVEKLNQGKYGVVYKISTLNSIDICLKIYHNKGKSKDSEIEKKRHGRLIEVQNLAFANQHSDIFVKMYLGRIGVENKNDAFMLTQYLGKGVKIDKTNPDKKDDDYEFRALDNHSDNYKKCGKRKIIIDAGAIIIIKKSTGDIVGDF